MLKFNDLTGLQIAIRIETHGQEFYRHAYDHAAKPEHKELFMLLMNDEIHHRQTFQNILAAVENNADLKSLDSYFDEETAEYLNALAKSHIFPKTADAHQTIADFKDFTAILQTAMQAEKDSVQFYGELAKHARCSEVKEVCKKFKDEEQQHVEKLREFIEAYG